MTISLWESLAKRTEVMAENAFSDIFSLQDWELERPARLREFLSALGIGELPERGDLRITDYGTFSGEGYTARKIGFQILPACWSSAVMYYPAPGHSPSSPGVLYVCGHATNGVYHYHPHGIMWARRGYVCLMVDTIEQADNPGEHHGHSMRFQDAWISLGYSSAGGETWNSIRALDVLAEDPRVDPRRLGVTGVSGGGAVSFYLAAVDDRIKAVSSLCGISTPVDAVRNRHLTGHCDCFYPVNLYRRDLSDYAALIAPRAAMFCFADHDTLFHPAETLAFVERTRKIYQLYKQKDFCLRVTCPGPHGDHPEFDKATAEFFDNHVAGEKSPDVSRRDPEFKEREISIFNGKTPEPNRLDLLPHLLSVRSSISLPNGPEDWEKIREQALGTLPFPLDDGTPSHMQLDGDWRWGPVDGTAVRAHRGEIDGIDVWLNAVTPVDSAPKVVIGVANAGENSMQAMCAVAISLEKDVAAYGGFEPRAAGNNMPVDIPEAFPPGSRIQSSRKLLIRAMVLTGQTPALMTFQDLKLLVNYLTQLEEMKGREIYLHGRGDGATAVLYRGLVDDRITGVFLEDLPSSHLVGSPIPGVSRSFDIPQAVGLMAPRKVALIRPGHSFWSWPTRVYERLGCPENFITVDDTRHAMSKLLNKSINRKRKK